MITIQLTEAEAARIFYALSAEAAEHHSRARNEIKNGALSAASGRLQIINENARDECLAIVRKVKTRLDLTEMTGRSDSTGGYLGIMTGYYTF